MKEIGGKDAVAMPISGHLRELRRRLIKSLFVLFFFFCSAFYLSAEVVSWFHSLLDAPLVFLSPAEAFWTDLKIALFIGFLCSLPFIVYEVWGFVSPGLLVEERRQYRPFLIFAVFFFFLGIAFCYSVALPFALRFLIDYGRQSGLTPQISISMYVDFVLKFLIAFGLIFELPVVMILLSKIGLLTVENLTGHRKYAILAVFFIAAILTPTPDIFNQCMMAVPMICLYEIGIVAVRILGTGDMKRQETAGDDKR